MFCSFLALFRCVLLPPSLFFSSPPPPYKGPPMLFPPTPRPVLDSSSHASSLVQPTRPHAHPWTSHSQSHKPHAPSSCAARVVGNTLSKDAVLSFRYQSPVTNLQIVASGLLSSSFFRLLSPPSLAQPLAFVALPAAHNKVPVIRRDRPSAAMRP